ncbi:hypothetical protein [Streptomyces sp. NPDC127112]|uniref:hypothetical protein n=1 Tax=Streptomyces sp. NPDC127112 TaxID=3345364 RepID=UPI0036388FD2
MSSTERWVYERELEARSARGAYSRAAPRYARCTTSTLQWPAAEDYTRGNLLNRKARAAGHDPRSLFSGPAYVAYARASEGLIRFWEDVSPRITLAEFSEKATGVRTDAGETARQSAHAQWLKP